MIYTKNLGEKQTKTNNLKKTHQFNPNRKNFCQTMPDWNLHFTFNVFNTIKGWRLAENIWPTFIICVANKSEVYIWLPTSMCEYWSLSLQGLLAQLSSSSLCSHFSLSVSGYLRLFIFLFLFWLFLFGDVLNFTFALFMVVVYHTHIMCDCHMLTTFIINTILLLTHKIE